MNRIPEDAAILFSFLNTMLRDRFESLDELCGELDADKEEILSRMEEAGYVYDPLQNRFL